MAWVEDSVGLDVATAGAHISERIGREVASRIDLEESLEASRYASHLYSSPPKEWPALFEIVETRELPLVLIERYSTAGGESTALCGIFPEIRRAWASVDNSLFLWRYDKWDGQCSQFSGQEQAICAVGLAKCRPGVFAQAINYLLVLATPVELLLLGLCCMGRVDGGDPFDELSLTPLPQYVVPSDGVTMTCIACSDQGHIFLAGRDGHIYEIQYSSGTGWNKRCQKICLTTSLSSLISRWVLPNVFKFGAVDAIAEMVIDSDRCILYARTEGMKLQVFDLGGMCEGPLKKIAEERNLIDPREAQYGARRSTGSRTTNRSTKPSIVSIAPLSTIESKRLHLVAVLSDGRRLFLSTSSHGNNSSVSALKERKSTNQKPCCLKIVATRPSPPLGVGGGFTTLSVSGRVQAEDLSLKVEAAFYSAGTVVFSDSTSPALSSFLIVARDSSAQLPISGNFGTTARSSHALREFVSSLPAEGRMLCATDVPPHHGISATVQSLYMDAEPCVLVGEPYEKTAGKLLARGDLATQHILPRRRVVVFNTIGIVEVAFNRPVDILRKLLERNASRPQIEDFFNRFGAAEAAVMCLLLAAKLAYTEGNLISNTVSEKAAEAFEDPRLVGLPQLDGVSGQSTAGTSSGGFSMGQVVQVAEPVFSGAHEGLCLCSSRLLFPIWELPVMIVRSEVGSGALIEDGVIVCRLAPVAMQVLEEKLQSLEQFLRSRRNQRRGLYGYVSGLGDTAGSVLLGTNADYADSRSSSRTLLGLQLQNSESGDGARPTRRKHLSYSSAELAAMEVRAMECIRRLLRRSSEALFLLQLLSQHHLARLVQRFDNASRQRLVQLTFHQLVCSEEGDQLAVLLISSLVEYHIGPDGKGTLDELSVKLREGCPSYFNESNYKYFLSVERLERAAASSNPAERELLAREAFDLLNDVPDSADLINVCHRFEDLRFYEAVVRLPLQKALTLDPQGDAVNDKIDPSRRNHALVQRQQCYEIIMNALSSLKGELGPQGIGKVVLDQASRDKFIRQIIQLGVQWPDTTFHEYLYQTLIVLGLENELLEYGGSDLVAFLQSAGKRPNNEAHGVNIGTSISTTMHGLAESATSNQTKYLDLLARYYVLKRQHSLAAQILYRLAERQCVNAGDGPTMEQRRQYLSNAVLQAKSAASGPGRLSSNKSTVDDGLLDMLEAKLLILGFQIKIKDELESIASKFEPSSASQSLQTEPFRPSGLVSDVEITRVAKEKANELSLVPKSITQLYNDYAVPFKLWEACLEMLNFANYAGEVDNKVIRETWARLLDQAISKGGVAEACSVLKRLGLNLYPGDGASLPLDTLCLHLEKAAMERLASGLELVGDEDVPRALLAACRGPCEAVLSIYDQLLSNCVVTSSSNLRLRLLRSVLAVLREWALSIPSSRMDSSTSGLPLIYGGRLVRGQTNVTNQGMREKITNAANGYMTDVRRLPLPQAQTEAVYRGFRELEERLLTSI